MDVARRLKLGLAALLAVAASGFFAVPAFADTQPDPQLTNVPYLAWRGEEVRLVKCFPTIPRSAAFTQTDFLLVDWSGDPTLTAKPQLEPGTVTHFFRSFDGVPCVAGTFQSDKAGLAQIKLVVTLNLPTGGTNAGPGFVTLKHDFLVGWMNINTVAVNNVTPLASTRTLAGSDCPAGGALAPGPISEVAGTFNCLRVDVTGQIPLLQDFSELGIGNQLIMPTDWAKLATAVATYEDPANPNPAALWDIHDDQTPAEGHSLDSQTACATFDSSGAGLKHIGFIDAVDNCSATTVANSAPAGGPYSGVVVQSEVGPFSRVWAGFTNPTIGPFDPQRPSETLLSNGVLDAGDAPMPSLRIDFNIGAGGVGSFCTVQTGQPLAPPAGVAALCNSVDKHVVYSRNNLGSDPTAGGHNLYAPFYAEYLPAAFPAPAVAQSRIQPEASGVAGTFDANNFNGFLTQSGSPFIGRPFPVDTANGTCSSVGQNIFDSECDWYHFWDVYTITGPKTAVAQKCLEFTSLPEGVTRINPATGKPFLPGQPVPFFSPSGFQTAVVYTDEHGEARIRFSSGTGFNFNSLPVNINLNSGCDLAGITELGRANVTATARYPFESVTARPVTSNVVTKVITSGFSKTITCLPKGTGANNAQVAICYATAQDITGTPIAGETICFTADLNAESIIPFPELPNTTVALPTGVTAGPLQLAQGPSGTNLRCVLTNSSGIAAVEVVNSNATTVDVTAKFVNEGLFRFIKVAFPITTTVTSTGVADTSTQTSSNGTSPPTSATSSSSSSSTNSSSNNSSTSTSSNNSSASNNANPAVQYRVVAARIVRTAKGRATLHVRVNGPAGKANLLIKITSRHKTFTYQRAVTANRMVTIRGLRVPTKGALRVSLSIVT